MHGYELIVAYIYTLCAANSASNSIADCPCSNRSGRDYWRWHNVERSDNWRVAETGWPLHLRGQLNYTFVYELHFGSSWVKTSILLFLSSCDLHIVTVACILESIFSPKFKALKVLEKKTGAQKSLSFIPQVLGNPWIHHEIKLCDHQIH